MRWGTQCELFGPSVCDGDSMYVIEPFSGVTNSCVAYARSNCLMIWSGVMPAMTHSVCLSTVGRTVRDAGGLKQCGASSLVFQRSGAVSGSDRDRTTRHVNPFVPLTASVNPVRPRTMIVAESEIHFGAAVRASAISAARSGIR